MSASKLKLLNLTDPAVAEALAVLSAVVFSRDLGLQKVMLKGNAFQIVLALKIGERSWSRHGQSVEDARVILNNLQGWKVNHVKKEANFAALRLVKAILHQPGEHFLVFCFL